MDGSSYGVGHAVLEPGSVQRVSRDSSGGRKLEPIDFILSEHTGTTQLTVWERMRLSADEFRLWLATTCCACLSSVPSFALVIIAAVLIMLLVSSIPLAFVLTRMRSEMSTAADSDSQQEISADSPMFVDRTHNAWPASSDIVKYHDWDDDGGLVLHASSLIPPNVTMCSVYGFACTDHPHIVIPKNRRCDGYADCVDGSDEKDCHVCQTTLSCPMTSDPSSKQLLCLVGEHLCDGLIHCGNGEDESPDKYCRSDCDSSQFSCKLAEVCIPSEAVCDGVQQCPLGDDEHNCEETKCRGGAKRCGIKCLAKRWLCDGEVNCMEEGSKGSDEMDCDCASCSSKNSVLCNGEQKLCMDKHKLCDGIVDCPGGEDEQGCHGICPSPKLDDEHSTKMTKKKNSSEEEEFIRCQDGKLYHWKSACNGMNKECSQSCRRCNPETAFECGVTNKVGSNSTSMLKTFEKDTKDESDVKDCILRSMVCDGKKDCADGSDEADCSCEADATKCRDIGVLVSDRCYRDSQKCDGFMDCGGGEDERDCAECKNGAFLCRSEQRCIPSMQRCDGTENCADHSDETDCTCEECSGFASRNMYMCTESRQCLPLADVCGPNNLCPNATKMDDLYCAMRTQHGLDHF